MGKQGKGNKKKLSFRILNQNIRGIVGSEVCHAVRYWMFSFEARVCFPGRLHETCDGQIGATTGLLSSEYFHFFLSATISTSSQYAFVIRAMNSGSSCIGSSFTTRQE
jgi:hypothetical protein